METLVITLDVFTSKFELLNTSNDKVYVIKDNIFTKKLFKSYWDNELHKCFDYANRVGKNIKIKSTDKLDKESYDKLFTYLEEKQKS